MNRILLELVYKAKIKKLMKQAKEIGCMINPKTTSIPIGCSILEYNDAWILNLVELITSKGIKTETSILFVPVSILLTTVSMSSYFMFNKSYEVIIGPYCAGCLMDNIPVVAIPNCVDTDLYVYDILTEDVASIKLVGGEQ